MINCCLNYLKYHFKKLSKVSSIGILLTFIAIILIFFNEFYQKKELLKLERILAQNKNLLQLNAKKVHIEPSNMDFYEKLSLPSKMELPDIIEAIEQQAQKNNLDFNNINYKLYELPTIKSYEYDFTLPVIGTYLDVRKFIEEVRKINQGIVLKNLVLSREDSQFNKVHAVFEYKIYLERSK